MESDMTMNGYSEAGKKLINELEIFLLQHGVALANGSRLDGLDPTDNEKRVWYVYAALVSGDPVSDPWVRATQDILERTRMKAGEVTLRKSTRTFTKFGNQLARSEHHLDAGALVSVSEPERVIYDHRDQLAVSFKFEDGKTHYLLVSEMHI